MKDRVENFKGIVGGSRWVKGKSGNPGGRTKAHMAVLKMQHELIAEHTDGGREIIKFVVEVFKGIHPTVYDAKSMRWATDFLADRLWGRAPVTVTIKPEKRVEIDDLKTMSIAELEQLAAEPSALPALPEPDEPGSDVPSGDVH